MTSFDPDGGNRNQAGDGSTFSSSPDPYASYRQRQSRPDGQWDHVYVEATPVDSESDRNQNTGKSYSQPPIMSPEDFEKLCKSIEQNVAKITDAVGKGLGGAGSAMGDAINSAVSNFQQSYSQKHTPPQTPPYRRINTSNANDRGKRAILKQRFKSPTPLKISGIAMAATGGIFTLSFGGAAVTGAATLDAFVGAPLIATAASIGACLVLTGLSVWLLVAGVKRIGIAGRARDFRRIFGNREVCTISELAYQTQSTEKKTLSDAGKILKYNLLPQGRIDDEGTCVIVTDDAYRHYRQAQSEYKKTLVQNHSEEMARERVRSHGEKPPMTSEVVTFVESGRSYLAQLKDLDVAIDDEMVSSRISEISNIVSRILQRVEEFPEVISSLDKLESYYLPTTVKLLVAYDDLEHQPIQGDNVTKSRREIEKTLDTLVGAYEKLLDETYEDITLDVAADISVLHTILAQEGLTENPFDDKDDSRG